MASNYLLAALLVVSAASGCATLSEDERSTARRLGGQWGEVDSKDCEVNPQTISFSPAMRKMYVRYPNGGTSDNKELRHGFTYRVLSASNQRVRLFLLGESRKDAADLSVTWDAVLLADNRFCWRRSDWPDSECTVVRVRCGP